uniref:Uncharacterized protein n=1 Tax=Romanomermis culicivorax TaxID=13658 RepID=A0A915IFW5_ROMCU
MICRRGIIDVDFQRSTNRRALGAGAFGNRGQRFGIRFHGQSLEVQELESIGAAKELVQAGPTRLDKANTQLQPVLGQHLLCHGILEHKNPKIFLPLRAKIRKIDVEIADPEITNMSNKHPLCVLNIALTQETQKYLSSSLAGITKNC